MVVGKSGNRGKRKDRSRNKTRREQYRDQRTASPAMGNNVPIGRYFKLDLHGKTTAEATPFIESALRDNYRGYDGIHFVHGSNNGVVLRNLLESILQKAGMKCFREKRDLGSTYVPLD